MTVQNKKLLTLALTHSSISKENNERLEFLGDRVIGLIISDLLYVQFPDESEGDLAKRLAVLVSTDTLGEIARELKLHTQLNVSHELQKNLKDQSHILANTMEAYLGALYLDQGLEETKKFVKEIWGQRIHDMTEPPKDAKSELQEYLQKEHDALPNYSLVKQTGEDHAPIFIMKVKTPIGSAQGKGKTKKEAAQNAAQNLLDELSI